MNAARKPLFVYGTLRDDDVLRAVIGRGLDALDPYPAVLPGMVARRVKDEVYPGLRVMDGGHAPGLLLFALADDDLAKLDRFEGAAYRRTAVLVHTGEGRMGAEVYLPTTALALTDEPWTLEAWRGEGKARFLSRYAGFR